MNFSFRSQNNKSINDILKKTSRHMKVMFPSRIRLTIGCMFVKADTSSFFSFKLNNFPRQLIESTCPWQTWHGRHHGGSLALLCTNSAVVPLSNQKMSLLCTRWAHWYHSRRMKITDLFDDPYKQGILYRKMNGYRSVVSASYCPTTEVLMEGHPIVVRLMVVMYCGILIWCAVKQ